MIVEIIKYYLFSCEGVRRQFNLTEGALSQWFT